MASKNFAGSADELAFGISAAVTRLNLSRATIYRLIRAGRLPARKCGARTLILEVDLENFLASLPRVDGAPGPAGGQS